MMKINFLTFMIVIPIAVLCGCYSLRSQYGNKNIEEKICVYMNIENNYDRLFLKKLKEKPNVTTLENCDYLLIAYIYDIERAITDASGINIGNKTVMNVRYTLYQYDKKKYLKIKDILDNPSLYTFDQYTGGGFIQSLSKGNGSAANEQGERRFEVKNSSNLYISTKLRINKLLPIVTQGQDMEESFYMINYNLLTTLNQSRFDTENQLVGTLAERVMDDVMIDIVNYKQLQQKQKCRDYYNKYMESYDDNLNVFKYKKSVLNEKNEQAEAVKTFIENKCKSEFKKIEKEKRLPSLESDSVKLSTVKSQYKQ